LREEQNRLRKHPKFANILPFQSRSQFSIYYSSSLKSSPISKFERTFEVIRKNERNYKETMRRYNFKKPKRKTNPSEQVSLISISDFKKEL